eukprot:TRINITY_DN2512_c1_g2_i1.p1 TRINITY_DN2512_c1_g2~~TRINITY_DN2512_c1_g2_i1.p1  ORF type:complete len:328 (-),score=80.80 TRINITY_DN2512_c1_g2_i1:221-1078(-)
MDSSWTIVRTDSVPHVASGGGSSLSAPPSSSSSRGSSPLPSYQAASQFINTAKYDVDFSLEIGVIKRYEETCRAREAEQRKMEEEEEEKREKAEKEKEVKKAEIGKKKVAPIPPPPAASRSRASSDASHSPLHPPPPPPVVSQEEPPPREHHVQPLPPPLPHSVNPYETGASGGEVKREERRSESLAEPHSHSGSFRLGDIPRSCRTERRIPLFLDLHCNMGFPLDRVEFVIEACDTDKKKCVDALVSYADLIEEGHRDDEVKEALLLSDMSLSAARAYLKTSSQ